MPRDYYDELGVAREATPAQIKKAYRKLARQYHPDVNRDDPQAAERFKAVQHAYDILSDKETREAYDRYGHAAEQMGEGGPPPGWPPPGGGGGWEFRGGPGGFGGGGQEFRFTSGGADGADMQDILSQLFGGAAGAGRAQAPSQRGTDYEAELHLSLEEVLAGTTRDLSLTVEDTCTSCRGRGIVPPGQPCAVCGGRGQVRRQQTVRGVKIPAGADNGSTVRLRGKGGAGHGGPPGDINLRIVWREHPFFRPSGDDLECEVPVSLAEASLGGEIPVPTLRGMRTLRIPAGTSSGTRFRIREGGLPSRRAKTTGNLVVRVKVVVPAAEGEAETKAVTEMSARAGDPRAGLWRPQEQ